MPKIQSAKKALRVAKRRSARNEKFRTKLDRARRKTLKLIELGDATLAENQLKSAYKALDKAAKTNIIHKKTASRIKSRLAKKVQKIDKDVKTAPKNP